MKISKVQLRKWNENTTDNHNFLDKNGPDTKELLWSHCYNSRDLTFSIAPHCTAHVMEASLVSVVSFFTDLDSVIFLFFLQSVLGLCIMGLKLLLNRILSFTSIFFNYIFFYAGYTLNALGCTKYHQVIKQHGGIKMNLKCTK